MKLNEIVLNEVATDKFKFDKSQMNVLHHVASTESKLSKEDAEIAKALLAGKDPSDGKVEPHKQVLMLFKKVQAAREKAGDEKTPSKKAFVTMTDKHMSGWGDAKGKINKLIFVCDSEEEAEIVKDNAVHHGSMKNVNVVYKKPTYNSEKYLAQVKDKKSSPRWYTSGHFKNQK